MRTLFCLAVIILAATMLPCAVCAQAMYIPPMSDPFWNTATGIKFRCNLEMAAEAVYGEPRQLPDSPAPNIPASKMPRAERDVYLAKKYPDTFLHIDQPVSSFKEAATGRGMLIFESLFIASNVMDEEGTQHCIAIRACREGNPIIGDGRARAYAIGGALAAAVIVSAVELRKHQHGSAALVMLWVPTAIHTVLAVHGWRNDGVPAPKR